MAVQPCDFVTAAETLSAGATEIDWRNAVSRAYYGAFHHASLHVDRCKAIPHHAERGGSHEAAIRRFELNGDTAGKSIAYVLTDMKTKRKTADYRIESGVSAAEAVTQVAKARKVIQKISDYFDASNSDAV